MDALEYLADIRIAPNGQALDKSEKLTLLLLALCQNESGDSQPDIDRLADRVLVNRRSMFRILASLESKRAIEGTPQTTPTGQSAPTKYKLLDAKGRVLYITPSVGGRVLQMIGESVTERGEGVTHNTPENVTRNTLAIVPNPPQTNNLPPASFGTAFASPNNPNTPIREASREGVTHNTLGGQNPAVALWFEIVGIPFNVSLSPAQISLISERVANLAAWEYTLKGWAASKWYKDNVTGQVERYETKTLCLPQFQRSAAPPPRQKTEEDAADDARAKRLVYGDQG
jgi:hypothetical protein